MHQLVVRFDGLLNMPGPGSERACQDAVITLFRSARQLGPTINLYQHVSVPRGKGLVPA